MTSSAVKSKNTKKRINLSPEKKDFQFIEKIARRDNMPIAKKTMELLKLALSIEEDAYFSQLAEKRIQTPSQTLSSENFWEQAFSKKQ
jgi:hypothetical protein